MAEKQEAELPKRRKENVIHFWSLSNRAKKGIYLNLDGFEEYQECFGFGGGEAGYYERLLSALATKSLHNKFVKERDLPRIFHYLEKTSPLRRGDTKSYELARSIANSILAIDSDIVKSYKAAHSSFNFMLTLAIKSLLGGKYPPSVTIVELFSLFLTQGKAKYPQYSMEKIEGHVINARSMKSKKWTSIKFPIDFDKNPDKLRHVARLLAYMMFSGSPTASSIFSSKIYPVPRIKISLQEIFGVRYSKGEAKYILNKFNYGRFHIDKIYKYYIETLLEEPLSILSKKPDSHLPLKIVAPAKYFKIGEKKQREMHKEILTLAFEKVNVRSYYISKSDFDKLISSHHLSISNESEGSLMQLRTMLEGMGFRRYGDNARTVEIMPIIEGIEERKNEKYTLYIAGLSNLKLFLHQFDKLEVRSELCNWAYKFTRAASLVFYYTLKNLYPEKEKEKPKLQIRELFKKFPQDLMEIICPSSENIHKNIAVYLCKSTRKPKYITSWRPPGARGSTGGDEWFIAPDGIKLFDMLQKRYGNQEPPSEECLDYLSWFYLYPKYFT